MLFPSRTRLQHSAAKKQARANARACFDRVSLIPVPVPCAPVCNPVYKIAFSLFLSRRILFFHPEESERLQGRPAYAAASPGAKRTKTDAVSSYLWEPPCIQVLFLGTDAAACPRCRLLGQIRRRAFCRKCGPPPLFGLQVPAGSPAAFGQPAGTAPTPSLYTARPICRLTFPLGSDTISIKHRKGRPAPWPSS